MITDERFIEFIAQIGEQYEELKDLVVKHCDTTDGMIELYGKLADFRDTACIALRASHTTQNPQQN